MRTWLALDDRRATGRLPRRRCIPCAGLAILILAGVIAHACGPTHLRENAPSPRELIARAHASAVADPESAIRLAREAADANQAAGTDTAHRLQELAARWYLTHLLRVSLLAGRTDSERVSLYRNQLNQLDALLPIDQPRALLELLHAELGLILFDTSEAIVRATAAIRSASPEEAPGSTPDELSVLNVSNKTVELLLGIALARKGLRAEGLPPLLEAALQDAIDPRFRQWVPEGQTKLILVYVARGDYERAGHLLDQFAPLSQAGWYRASILGQMAVVSLSAGHLDRATKFVDEALPLSQAEPDRLARARLLGVLVAPLLEVGALQKAEAAFTTAAELVAADPDASRHLLKTVETLILPAIENWDRPQTGARIYETLLSLSSLGDPATSLVLNVALGRFYARMRQVHAFFRVWEKAHGAHRLVPNWPAMQDLYLSSARLLSSFDPPRAADVYRAALRIGYGHFLSDAGLFFRGLRDAMALAMEIGHYQDAVDFALAGRGLALGTKTVDARAVDIVVEFLVEAGEAMTELGRFDLGWDAFVTASTLAKDSIVGWDFRISAGLSRLAARAGDIATSMSILATRSNPPDSKAPHNTFLRRFPDYLLLTADLWTRWGNQLRGEQRYQECIQWVTRVMRRRDLEVRCRAGLVGLFRERGDIEASFEQYWKALEAARDTWTPLVHSAEWSTATFSLLLWGTSQNNPDQVESQVEDVMKLLRVVPPSPPVLAQQAAYEAVRLWAARQRGNRLDLAPLQAVLAKLFSEPYLSARELPWLYIVGVVLADLGERNLALDVFVEQASRLEFMRNALTTGRREPNLRLRIAFGSEIDRVFEHIVQLHLEAPAGALKALEAHEANRARAAGDLRRVATHEVMESGSDSSLGDTRRRLESAIARGDRDQVGAALDLLRLITEASERGPQLPAPKATSSASRQHQALPRIPLTDVQGRLDPATAIIVFRLTQRVSGAWIISKDAVIWRTLPPLNTMEPAIQRFRWALQSPGDIDERRFREIASEAYVALLGPLDADVRQHKSLVVIPDGILFGVPLEALVIADGSETGRFLVETHRVSYQLSLGLLVSSDATDRRRLRPRQLLIVGDPARPPEGLERLAAAREEMDAIRQIFGEDRTVVYAGEAARRDILLGNLGEFAIVHLATHGVVKEQDPWYSYLAFSEPGGSLTLWDLSKLRLGAELVVLSACETARGRLLAGEGVWGFVAQFLGAGAKNVVASLWRVEDRSTASLMQEYYRAMSPNFTDYAGALRAAKLRIMKEERWRHPYFWAPFVLYGEAM